MGSDAGGLLSVGHFLGLTRSWHILFDFMAIAMCGGLYVVPLYAIMQHDSDPQSRARTIASNNAINALFMVLSAVMCALMLWASCSIPDIFLATAVMNGAVALYLWRQNLAGVLK